MPSDIDKPPRNSPKQVPVEPTKDEQEKAKE